MTNHAEVVVANGEIALTGDLDFANVMRVCEKGLSLFNSPQPILVFNFAELKTSNSAGLALIIEWMRRAKAANKRIEFRHISPKLLSIARAAGLDDVIPLK